MTLLLTSLFLPMIASAADFSYSHYESLPKHNVSTGVTINGLRLNAVDYAALAQEAKRLYSANYTKNTYH